MVIVAYRLGIDIGISAPSFQSTEPALFGVLYVPGRFAGLADHLPSLPEHIANHSWRCWESRSVCCCDKISTCTLWLEQR